MTLDFDKLDLSKEDKFILSLAMPNKYTEIKITEMPNGGIKTETFQKYKQANLDVIMQILAKCTDSATSKIIIDIVEGVTP